MTQLIVTQSLVLMKFHLIILFNHKYHMNVTYKMLGADHILSDIYIP